MFGGHTKTLWLGVFAGAAALLSTQTGTGQEAVVQAVPHVRFPSDAGSALFTLVQAELQPNKETAQGEYWLGVGLTRLPEVAKRQLALEGGLVVEEVAKESPAAKADIQKHDILVRAGDTPLKEPADLVKAVEAAKDKPLTLVVVRGGKDITVTVTPEKRPQDKETIRIFPRPVPPELRDEIRRLEDVLEKLKEKAGAQGLDLYFPRPGLVAPRVDFFLKPAELPKNLSIQISKEGEQPAKIRVQRDDQEWNVTEDKLGDLPDDVRPHVQHFLGRLSGAVLAQGGVKALISPKYMPGPATAPRPSGPPMPPVPPAAPQLRLRNIFSETGSLESKLDEVMKKLDELRKDVDQLRKSASESGKK